MHASDFILIFPNGHKSRNGDNSIKKKYVCQLFFHKESIYEISKPYHTWFIRYDMHVSNGRTHVRTHGQRETNMHRQLLRSWGHKILKGVGKYPKTRRRTDCRLKTQMAGRHTLKKSGGRRKFSEKFPKTRRCTDCRLKTQMAGRNTQ